MTGCLAGYFPSSHAWNAVENSLRGTEATVYGTELLSNKLEGVVKPLNQKGRQKSNYLLISSRIIPKELKNQSLFPQIWPSPRHFKKLKRTNFSQLLKE